MYSSRQYHQPVVCILLLLLLECGHEVYSFAADYKNFARTHSCSASQVFKISNAYDIVETILRAREKGLRVKAVGGRLSSNKIICTDGYALDMSALNKVDVDVDMKQVKAQAGAQLRRVHMELRKKGYSLTTSASAYEGVTIGGIFGTGSFASSLKVPALQDQVIRMTIVDGQGNKEVITGPSLRAASINLGVLGVVVDVTLPIVELFKLKVRVSNVSEDYVTEGTFLQNIRQYDLYYMSWFSSQKTIVLYKGVHKSGRIEGEDMQSEIYKFNIHLAEYVDNVDNAYQEALKGNTTAACDFEASNVRVQAFRECCGLQPYKDSDGEYNLPAIGWMHDMTSSYCKPGDCGWDNDEVRFNTIPSLMAIKLEDLPRAFQRIREILTRDRVCFVTFAGIEIVFLRKSDRYLSLSYGHNAAVIGFEHVLRRDPEEPTYSFGALREMELMLMKEFNARPAWHTSKALMEPSPPVQDLYPKWMYFEDKRRTMDPRNLFGNDFYDVVRRKKKAKKTELCSVMSTCNCSEDSHCAVGETCQQRKINGTIFRLCRLEQ